MVLPRTDGIHGYAGIHKTANIIEPQCGCAFADAACRVRSGGQIRLGIDLFTDPEQLPLGLPARLKTTQIIKSHYAFSCENSVPPASRPNVWLAAATDQTDPARAQQYAA